MKKKIVSAVLALCMVLGSAASLPEKAFVSSTDISASAYLEEYYGDYEFHTGYEKSNDGTYREIARLSLYLGNATNVVIPDNMVIEDNTSATPIKHYAVTILEGEGVLLAVEVDLPYGITSLGSTRCFFQEVRSEWQHNLIIHTRICFVRSEYSNISVSSSIEGIAPL